MIQGMSLLNKDKKLEGTPYAISSPVSSAIEGFDNNAVWSAETNLFNALNAFNSDYMAYVKCKNTGDTTCNTSKVRENTSALETRLKTAQDSTSTAVLFPVMNTMLNATRNGPVGRTQAQYNTTRDTIKTQAALNSQLRNDLDMKLRELNQTQDSIANSHKQQYDSTIYTGILLTAVATSLLFLVFKEL